jgi:hypothetical protein
MRYELNLATRPFVNTTIPLLISLLVAAGIIAFTAFNVSVLQASAAGGSYGDRIEEATNRNQQFREMISEIENSLRQIDLGQLSERIEFANGIIEARSRNLSLMLDRLEQLFGDKNVRARSISTNIQGDSVQLRMVVEDEGDEALRLVDDLRSSPYLRNAYIREESALTDGTGKSWNIEVTYFFTERE